VVQLARVLACCAPPLGLCFTGMDSAVCIMEVSPWAKTTSAQQLLMYLCDIGCRLACRGGPKLLQQLVMAIASCLRIAIRINNAPSLELLFSS